MSYAEFESSVEDGAPVRLYAFTLNTTTWRYNTTDRQVLTVDGNVWLPAAIEDDGVKQSGDNISDALTITSQSDIAPVQLWKLAPPSATTRIVISEKHIGDDEVYVQYVGEVRQISEGTIGTATIKCETLSASLEREGLRMVWQRSCPHMVYDHNCRLSATANSVSAVVQTINGQELVVVGMPAGSNDFTGGFIEWAHPIKGIERMAIEVQSNNVIAVFGFPTEIQVGMQITAYRGCNQTPAACKAFGNYLNYGGFEYLPGKSPFDGIASPFF